MLLSVIQERVFTVQSHEEKTSAAVELGRLGGLKGGPARAQSASSEEKEEIGRNAARVRWQKPSVRKMEKVIEMGSRIAQLREELADAEGRLRDLLSQDDISVPGPVQQPAHQTVAHQSVQQPAPQVRRAYNLAKAPLETLMIERFKRSPDRGFRASYFDDVLGDHKRQTLHILLIRLERRGLIKRIGRGFYKINEKNSGVRSVGNGHDHEENEPADSQDEDECRENGDEEGSDGQEEDSEDDES